MLGIRKKPFQGKSKRVLVTIDKFCLEGEEVAGALAAAESKNCDCGDGSIKNGLGITMFKLNGKNVPVNFTGNIHGLYYVDGRGGIDELQGARMFYCVPKDEKAYLYDETSKTFAYQFDLSKGSRYCMAANALNEWYAIFTSKNGYYVVNPPYFAENTVEGVTNAICFCKGRTFLGQRPRRLMYSGVDEPWFFTETLNDSGVIALGEDVGDIVALIPFHDRVYVFMDYGVAELEVTGSPLDFKIKPLDYSGGKIFGASVGVCNNHIMFLTENGVVRFNGNRFEMVAKNLRISPKEDTQVCGYAVCGDNYIVRYQALSAEKRTAVVRSDGKGYFITDREGLTQSGGKALCVVNGYAYEIVSDGYLVGTERFYFKSRKTNFGINKKKVVRSFRLEGEGNYTLYVYCDGVWRHSTVAFEDGVAVIPVHRQGKEFAFEFQLEQGAVIRKITAEIVTTA